MQEPLTAEALRETLMRDFEGDYREFYFDWCRDIPGWTETPEDLDRLQWDHPLIKKALEYSLATSRDERFLREQANRRLYRAVMRFIDEERRVLMAASETLDRLNATVSRCRLDPTIVNAVWNDWRVPRFRLDEYFVLLREHVDKVIFAGRNGWQMFLDEEWDRPVEYRLAAIVSVIRYYQLQDFELLNNMARVAAERPPTDTQ